MKQILALSLLALITIAGNGSASVAQLDTEASGQAFGIRELIVDSRDLQLYMKDFPELGQIYIDEHGRTIVPLRVIADCLDLPIHWEEETQTIYFFGGRGGVVSFQIGSYEYMVGDKKYEMDTMPVLDEGRTYLPLRYVVESLGGTISATQHDGLMIVAQMPWTTSQATMGSRLKGEEILDLTDKLSLTSSTISFLAKTDQETIFLLNDPVTLIMVKDLDGNIERIPLTAEDRHSVQFVVSESRQELVLSTYVRDIEKERHEKPSLMAFDFQGKLLWEKEAETIPLPMEYSDGWAYMDMGTLNLLDWEGRERNRIVIPEQYLGVMTMPHHIGDSTIAVVAAKEDGSTELSLFSRDGKYLRSQAGIAWRNATSFIQGDSENGYIFGSASNNRQNKAFISDRIGVYKSDYYGNVTRVKTLCLPETYQNKRITLSHSLMSDGGIDLYGVVWNKEGGFEHQFLMQLSHDLAIIALHELDVGSFNQVVFAQDFGTEIIMVTSQSEHLLSTQNILKIWKVPK